VKSKHTGRRIDRRTAERLLRGAPVDTPDALAGLLAAAAAPPRDGELGGEHAAVAAFAELAHRTPDAGRPSLLSAPKKLFTAKVAAIAAAIFAVGGVATATVALSVPSGESPPTAPLTSSLATTSSPVESASAGAPGEPAATHEPSPSLVGLCHAYSAGNKAEHGKALESPAFTALIEAAGDKTKVEGYCAALLKEEPATTHTNDSAKGHDHPPGGPGKHPGGPPATHGKP
jgi:hypothetical protein